MSNLIGRRCKLKSSTDKEGVILKEWGPSQEKINFHFLVKWDSPELENTWEYEEHIMLI